MKNYYLYALVDPLSPEDFRYVGWTINTVARLKSHIKDGSAEGKKTYKACWIRQLLNEGRSPELLVLKTRLNVDEIKQLEVDTIKAFFEQGHKLTNLTKGGDGIIDLGDGEIGRRIAEGQKNSEKRQAMFKSEEYKKHCSEAGKKSHAEHPERREQTRGLNKDTHLNEGHKNKISAALKDVPKSDKAKENMSKARMGKEPWNKGLTDVYSEETIEKIKEKRKLQAPPNKDREFSDEWRKNLSESHKGYEITDEARANLSAAVKLSWIKRKADKLAKQEKERE